VSYSLILGSGGNMITNVLEKYEDHIFPNWVSLDPSTGMLSMSPPFHDEITEYVFSLKTTSSENAMVFAKQIYVTVNY
jgi:hypothetical protein